MNKLPIYYILVVTYIFAYLTVVTCRAELLQQHSLVESSVKLDMLRESSSIDVVYSDGFFSHTEYQKKTDVSTRPESALPPHVIEKPQGTLFGACRVVKGVLKRTGTGSCGLVFRLSASAPLNLAAVDSLEIAGSFSGRWRLAIADLSGYLLNDNQSTDIIIGPKGASLGLAPLVKKIDLTKVMSLVFLLDSSEGSASLEQIKFSQSLLAAAPKPHGIWMWNNRLVPGHEEEVVGHLVSHGIGRVYLQIDDDPGRFLLFVEAAGKKGIEVFALDGDPEYVKNPEPLLRRISKVANLARSASGVTFAGFQVVQKGSNRLGSYETVVSNLHKNGIAIQGYFMFGFDNDTEESFQLTYDFIMKNKIEFPVFSLVTPFPGTPYFDEMKPRIRHFDWDKYDTYHYMFEPNKMSGEKLLSNFVKLQQEVYKGRAIMQRMKGKPLNWIWLANYMMNRFTGRLTPESYL